MQPTFDTLMKAELEKLAAHTAQACVSIHFSPYRASREVRQDSIRLRNLLDTAVAQLGGLGLRRPEVEDILGPGRALVDDARSRYEELAGRQGAGRGELRALDRIADVVPAASEGRVGSLFVAVDATEWGRVDESGRSAEVHPAPEPGDEDLLNRAAVETWLRGRRGLAVPAERIPGRTPAAAILRC